MFHFCYDLLGNICQVRGENGRIPLHLPSKWQISNLCETFRKFRVKTIYKQNQTLNILHMFMKIKTKKKKKKHNGTKSTPYSAIYTRHLYFYYFSFFFVVVDTYIVCSRMRMLYHYVGAIKKCGLRVQHIIYTYVYIYTFNWWTHLFIRAEIMETLDTFEYITTKLGSQNKIMANMVLLIKYNAMNLLILLYFDNNRMKLNCNWI